MTRPVPGHQSPATGPDLFSIAEDNHEKARGHGYGTDEERYHQQAAQYHATQAQTAAFVMIAEILANGLGVDHQDLDAWRECVGLSYPRPWPADRETKEGTDEDTAP